MRFRWRDRLRYRFDNTVSRGAAGLMAWLFILSAAFLFLVAVVSMAAGIMVKDDRPMRLTEVLWFNLLRALDAGTIGGDTGSTAFLATGFLVTVGGIFLVSTLIGLLTSGIEAKIEELRKGRSAVCEENHTIILGWSSQVFTIIRELVIANESRRGATIVILSEMDKIGMEDAIAAQVAETRGTTIVCRTGSPIDPTDVAITNPQDARSVIILPPESSDNQDAYVIKAMLSISALPSSQDKGHHIVAAMRDPRNVELAGLIRGAQPQLVLSEDLLARIIVQACRQSGLSLVYQELLDFDGVEIYMHAAREVIGMSFGEALHEFDTSTVIGIRENSGRSVINPPMSRKIAADEQLVVIAEDDSTIAVAPRSAVDEAAILSKVPPPHPAERTIVIGWNHRGTAIIRRLDAFVPEGFEIQVVADAREAQQQLDAIRGELTRSKVKLAVADTADRRVLDGLKLHSYRHIIVLSYSDDLDKQEADARTLVTLLHLRTLVARMPQRPAVVTEILDDKNRRLAQVAQADDYIVGDKLVSLMLSQVAENPEIKDVFADLFDPEGSEIYMKPAGYYVPVGTAVNFYTVVESARRRGQIALGYRVMALAKDASKAYGVVINPRKSRTVRFAASDQIIVIAEQ